MSLVVWFILLFVFVVLFLSASYAFVCLFVLLLCCFCLWLDVAVCLFVCVFCLLCVLFVMCLFVCFCLVFVLCCFLLFVFAVICMFVVGFCLFCFCLSLFVVCFCLCSLFFIFVDGFGGVSEMQEWLGYGNVPDLWRNRKRKPPLGHKMHKLQFDLNPDWFQNVKLHSDKLAASMTWIIAGYD